MHKFFRAFFPKNHPYRRATYAFNGKLERTQTPKIMTSTDQLRDYDREKEKEITEIFDSNGEPMFDDPRFFDTYDEKNPEGMNKKSIFYELPYQEHIKIAHLLDPMHKFKIVSCSLLCHISSKKHDKLKVRKDIIYVNTNRKHCPRQENSGKHGHSFSYKKGNVPWILKK